MIDNVSSVAADTLQMVYVHNEQLIWFQRVISNFGIRLISAIAILVIGKFAIRFARKAIGKIMDKRHTDIAVKGFMSSLIHGVLWVFVVIMALSQLGIQTTSFVAVLGAAGLAIGLALQGSLANFAAGFLIVLLRPFKIGDVVEVSSIIGFIREINLFNTEIMSYDNRRIIVPNSQIMNSTIINITGEELRRVDCMFSIGLSNDVEHIKSILSGVIDRHELVLKDKPPIIRLSAVTRDTMDFTVRAWCLTPNYWQLFFDITEQVKTEFDKNNVERPAAHFRVQN